MVAELSRLGVLDHAGIASAHAMKRLAAPEEIAGTIAYLLGPDAAFVTGEVLFADGGFSVYKVD